MFAYGGFGSFQLTGKFRQGNKTRCGEACGILCFFSHANQQGGICGWALPLPRREKKKKKTWRCLQRQ